jgi:hypothetical protein
VHKLSESLLVKLQQKIMSCKGAFKLKMTRGHLINGTADEISHYSLSGLDILLGGAL